MENDMPITPAPVKNTIRFSMPSAMLRLEGLALFIAALVLYGYSGYSWLAFIVFLLTPDLAFVVAALSKKAGTVAYNVAHFYGFPVLLAAFSVLTGSAPGLQVALIWFAHISMDRAVGYGFKYPGMLKETHLQRV